MRANVGGIATDDSQLLALRPRPLPNLLEERHRLQRIQREDGGHIVVLLRFRTQLVRKSKLRLRGWLDGAPTSGLLLLLLLRRAGRSGSCSAGCPCV